MKTITIDGKTFCPKMQWGETFTVNGVPSCPSCHRPAEQIISFHGEPGWAHKEPVEQRVIKAA